MNSNQPKIGNNSIINSCLVPFKSCLLNSFESSINATLQSLFDKAENAGSNLEETRMFEQYNLLKKFNLPLLDSLSNYISKMPDNISEQICMGDESMSLSIVEEEELEISLAFTQLEAVLDIKFTKYLHALEKRLKVLFAAKNITKSNMPFGVASICWIFSQTLDLSTSDIKIKTTIIEFLKKQLAVELLSVYKNIDQKFVQAGILPNILSEKKQKARDGSLKSHRKEASQDTSSYNDQQIQQGTQQDNQNHNNEQYMQQGMQQNQNSGQNMQQGMQQNQNNGQNMQHGMQQNQNNGQNMQQGMQQNQNNDQNMQQGMQQNQNNGQQMQQGMQQNQNNGQQMQQGMQQNQNNGQQMQQGDQSSHAPSNPNNHNYSTDNNSVQSKSSELVNSIFDLMNSGRTQGQQHTVEASNIDNSMMDNALVNLSKNTSVAAGSTEINKLKEMILEGVKNETGIYYPSLSTQQQNSLDVMGMFYDHVKQDTSIDDNMVSSLNAINLPLIRTAINDQSFFENENHPARKYLEKIIYASQKWHGTSIVKKLHKFSASIANDFDGSSDSFALANEDLQSYLRLTDRRVKKAEEKWVNAAKGKEKLEVSRHKVEEVVENISKTARPEFVQNVIKYVIQDSLTLSLLRHGEDSDEWHKSIKTSTVIAKMANPEQIKELTPKQKIESLHHLHQTMDELGFSENDITKTLSNIKECAEAATNDNLDEDINLQEVASINNSKNKNVKKAGSANIEDLRPLTDIEKSELTKIRLMPYGTIFDFVINQQRDIIRRRLSWFSPVSNKALFVSLLGKRPYEKSLNAIAIELARKNIIVVKEEKKKYFNNMLGQIFSKLQGIVNN